MGRGLRKRQGWLMRFRDTLIIMFLYLRTVGTPEGLAMLLQWLPVLTEEMRAAFPTVHSVWKSRGDKGDQ